MLIDDVYHEYNEQLYIYIYNSFVFHIVRICHVLKLFLFVWVYFIMIFYIVYFMTANSDKTNTSKLQSMHYTMRIYEIKPTKIYEIEFEKMIIRYHVFVTMTRISENLN